MQVRECRICDGLYNVSAMVFLKSVYNDSGGVIAVCSECYELHVAIHLKKISFEVDNVNLLEYT